jgi:hypothetical protein
VAQRALTRRVLAVPGAIFLTVVIAGQALAFTWSQPTQFATGDAWGGAELATLGSTNAVVQYETCNTQCNVYTRRTTDSGTTWKAPVFIDAGSGTDGFIHDIAGLGQDVDTVWMFRDNAQLRYAHSSDAGASFGISLLLSSSADGAVSVSRGPSGLVAVAYDSGAGAAVRISTNGGTSFSNAKILSAAGYFPQVAVGTGIVYVAWVTDSSNGNFKLHVRTTTNGGTTWSTSSTPVSNAFDNSFSITAAANHAYLAYTVATGISYKRTLNNGGSWSSAMKLSAASGSWFPVITLQNGILRAIYGVITSTPDVHETDYYRQSSNGTSWTTPKPIPNSNTPLGVGYSGKIIVLYGAQPAARHS